MLKIIERVVSNNDTFEISPINASSNSGCGVIKKPKAKLKTKITPTKVSVGKKVFFSKNQINRTPAKRKTNAPNETFNPKSRAKPMPGKAT